jgi:hypothetical protein
LLFALFLSLVESLQEVRVFFIVDSFLYVEREREVVEDFLATGFIVLSHCVEESLLVPNDEVKGKVILYSDCL